MNARRARLLEIVSTYDIITGRVYIPWYVNLLNAILEVVSAIWFAWLAVICALAPIGLTLLVIWLCGGFR